MTSYIPKYQFSAICKRRESNNKSRFTFKYQQLLKSGKWGAVRVGDNRYNHGTPQEILDYWEKINPGKKFRLVEE